MLPIDTDPPAGQSPPGVVLTCSNPACRHTFEPDPVAFAAGGLACPACGGWTFQAGLAEPTRTTALTLLFPRAVIGSTPQLGKTCVARPCLSSSPAAEGGSR